MTRRAHLPCMLRPTILLPSCPFIENTHAKSERRCLVSTQHAVWNNTACAHLLMHRLLFSIKFKPSSTPVKKDICKFVRDVTRRGVGVRRPWCSTLKLATNFFHFARLPRTMNLRNYEIGCAALVVFCFTYFIFRGARAHIAISPSKDCMASVTL